MAMAFQITGSATFDTEEDLEILDKTDNIVDVLPMERTTEIYFVDDPEITDGIGDVFGLLSYIFPQDAFGFLDIVAAWFYENPDEPDYLSVTIKLNDLDFKSWHTIYSMQWMYNGVDQGVSVHTREKGAVASFFVTSGDDRYAIEGSLDAENDIVTFQIPKNVIGDPKPGDVLTNPVTLTSLRLGKRDHLLFMILIGELAKDYAGNGKNYIIQY
jgi:hypothetical protein